MTKLPTERRSRSSRRANGASPITLLLAIGSAPASAAWWAPRAWPTPTRRSSAPRTPSRPDRSSLSSRSRSVAHVRDRQPPAGRGATVAGSLPIRARLIDRARPAVTNGGARRQPSHGGREMPSLTNLLIVSVVAFAAPFLLGLFPGVRLPSVVLEIVAGIVIGPSVLGIVTADQAIAVVALIGLTFVLFLAGLEIDFARLRGPVLRLTALAFALSFGVAVAVSLGLKAAGLVDTPLLVAIILCATSLGVLVPVLKDAGEISSTFGQL